MPRWRGYDRCRSSSEPRSSVPALGSTGACWDHGIRRPVILGKTGLPIMPSLNTVESINDLFSVVVGIIRIVSAKARPMEITPQSLLLEELALDSLDLVRVIMLIEDRYHTAVDLDEIPKMKRVDDLTRILSRELRSAA